MNGMLKDIALEGAQRVLPRILKLLEALCSVDSESGHEAGNRQVCSLFWKSWAHRWKRSMSPDLAHTW